MYTAGKQATQMCMQLHAVQTHGTLLFNLLLLLLPPQDTPVCERHTPQQFEEFKALWGCCYHYDYTTMVTSRPPSPVPKCPLQSHHSQPLLHCSIVLLLLFWQPQVAHNAAAAAVVRGGSSEVHHNQVALHLLGLQGTADCPRVCCC